MRPNRLAHVCDERCVCPLDNTPLLYSPAWATHACPDPECPHAEHHDTPTRRTGETTMPDPLTARADLLTAANARTTDLAALIAAIAAEARRAAADTNADPRAALTALADHADRVLDIHRHATTASRAAEDDPMPVFVIKAKDKLAIRAVSAYRRFCEEEGLHEQASHVYQAGVEMCAWRERNPDAVKMPDHVHVPAR